jgi:hypothetical protein
LLFSDHGGPVRSTRVERVKTGFASWLGPDARIRRDRLYLRRSFKIDHVRKYDPANRHIEGLENNFGKILIENLMPLIDWASVVSTVCASKDKWERQGVG